MILKGQVHREQAKKMKSFGFSARAACFDPIPSGPIFGVLPPKPDPPRDHERRERRAGRLLEPVPPDYWVKERSERMRTGWLAAAQKRRELRDHLKPCVPGIPDGLA